MWAEAIAASEWPLRTFGGRTGRLLLGDMRERRQLGIDRYGTPLQRGNGRPAWVDAHQEALDLYAYLFLERAPWWMRWLAVFFAWAIRRRLP